MGKQIVKTKMVVQYNGHSFRKNGDLDLSFKADYSEIVNTLSLVRMINQNVVLKVKIGRNKTEELGTFSIKNVNIDRDGESKIKFNSEIDYVKVDKLADLTAEDVLIILQAKAIIDVDEDEEDEDDSGDAYE